MLVRFIKGHDVLGFGGRGGGFARKSTLELAGPVGGGVCGEVGESGDEFELRGEAEVERAPAVSPGYFWMREEDVEGDLTLYARPRLEVVDF